MTVFRFTPYTPKPGRRPREGVVASMAVVVLAATLGACDAPRQLPPDPRSTEYGVSAAPGRLSALEGDLSDGGDPAAGVAAMSRYGCGSCHLIPGVPGADALVGPPLTSWSHRSFIAGHLPNTPENLVHWIVMPQSVDPGNAMPNLGVTDGEARDIAAYLYTLE